MSRHAIEAGDVDLDPRSKNAALLLELGLDLNMVIPALVCPLEWARRAVR
jgi:hypothetical protein